MSKNKLTAVLAFAVLLLGCHSQIASADAPRRLNGAVSKDKLAEALASSGIQCVFQEGPSSQLLVDSVHLGTDAYYSGLTAGDVIQSINAAGGKLTISFKRGAAKYSVSLPLGKEVALDGTYDLTGAADKSLLKSAASRNAAQLKNRVPATDKSDRKIVDVAGPKIPIVDAGGMKMPIVDVNTPQGQLQRLARYNIEVVIDRTGSMSDIDGTNGLTKFEWCHSQIRSLAHALAPYQNRITITTFNTAFQTYPNCTLDSVEQIYSTLKPDGETDLVEPLMSRLNAAAAIWHKGARPTLIAVITDGLPNVPVNTAVVDQAIVDFTRGMSDPNEVVVTLLQIGDTFDGRDFCNRLATQLVAEGARFDIVHTVDFAQLKGEGLVNALLATITSQAARH